MPDPQSEQEKLIHYLSKFSLGAQFIFLPDHWRHGKSNNQPADLVWVANECLILMFMCAKETHALAEKNRSRFEKAQKKHNMPQIKRCLRRWRAGENITGTAISPNGETKYDISADSIAHVIVLSVIQSGATIAEADQAAAKELEVSMFATIPSASLAKITTAGGGPVDIITLVGSLSQTGPLTEARFDELGRDYVLRCRDLSGGAAVWNSSRDRAFKRLFDPLSGVRHDMHLAKPETHVLSDIGLLDMYRIMSAMHHLLMKGEEALTRNKTTSATIAWRLVNYQLWMMIGEIGNPKAMQAFDESLSAYGEVRKRDPRPLVAMIICAGTFTVTIGSEPVDRQPTYLRRLLDSQPNWLALLATGGNPNATVTAR